MTLLFACGVGTLPVPAFPGGRCVLLIIFSLTVTAFGAHRAYHVYYSTNPTSSEQTSDQRARARKTPSDVAFVLALLRLPLPTLLAATPLRQRRAQGGGCWRWRGIEEGSPSAFGFLHSAALPGLVERARGGGRSGVLAVFACSLLKPSPCIRVDVFSGLAHV